MKPPTKFELMRANRHIAEARGRGFPLSRNPIDALICEAQLQEQAPAVPTMEIDGVRYREDRPGSLFDCNGCAFFDDGIDCGRVNEIARAVFDRDCYGGSGVIYIKAEA